VNVLAAQVGADVLVVDVGVATDLEPHDRLLLRKVRRGTADLSQEPAMSRDETARAVLAGAGIAEELTGAGVDLLVTGDMGIGNTTPSSAIVAAITGARVRDVTGRGTGIDDQGWERKVAVIEGALALHRPNPADGLDVLAKVGGFEIGAIAGVLLGAAAHRCPIVIDGFISGAGALIAATLCHAVRDYLIAAHNSVEIGHRLILERLELTPLLNLNLRLGEGTGAAIAMQLVDDALAILHEMATFDEAGVSEQSAPVERQA
jgi:nicotinate-nucleotide--dimethylbenzimidazole phosphoribosyltransferase